MTERPYLVPYEASSTLVIVPALNGGFIVYEKPSGRNSMYEDTIIGAFSSRRDMLIALSEGEDLNSKSRGANFDVSVITKALSGSN